MNIDNLIALIVGMMIGTNFGFIFAGLFGGGDYDEEMPDQ